MVLTNDPHLIQVHHLTGVFPEIMMEEVIKLELA